MRAYNHALVLEGLVVYLKLHQQTDLPFNQRLLPFWTLFGCHFQEEYNKVEIATLAPLSNYKKNLKILTLLKINALLQTINELS